MRRQLRPLLVVLLTLGGCSSGGSVQFACTSFPNDLDPYWAGASFDGLDLSYAATRCDTPEGDGLEGPGPVSFSYGDCTPQGGTPCGPPIDIQSWPADAWRKPALPGTDITVSGVPATSYEGGRRLEIYHPGVTVVIFADDAALADRFATALVKAPRDSAELVSLGLDLDNSTGGGFGWFLMLAALFVISLAVGRWWLLMVPIAGVSLRFVGTYNGWWGNGFGEMWQLGFVMGLLFGMAIVAAGVVLHGRLPVRLRNG